MFCEVITLRKDGLRLRPDEWPEPVRGLLRIDQREASTNASRRTMREVKVMGEWVTTPMTLIFMFDPELIDTVGDGFLLRGHVVNSSSGRCHEHQQLWLVRPRTSGDGPPLPPFDARPWLKRLPVDESTGKERSASEQWLDAHPDAKS